MSTTPGGAFGRGIGSRRWQLFASDAGAPRTRRPADWFEAIAATAVVVGAGWASSSSLDLDRRVLELFAAMPDWLDTLASIGYFAGGVYAFAFVVALVVGGRGRAIVRDLVVALGLLAIVLTVAGRAVSGAWPDLLPEFVDPPSPPPFPGTRLALLTVVVATPAPHVTAPVRRFGRRMVWLVAVSGLVMGATDATGTIGAIALGWAIAATVHVLFGSPAGLPSTEQLRDALAGLGSPVESVTLLPEQPVGVALAEAVDADGRRYSVKIHGRDAADAELFHRVWRSLWYRDALSGWAITGLQQVEHEAVLTLMAERHGAPVARLVSVGRDANDNAFLVLDDEERRLLADLSADEVADDMLDAVWEALAALHRAGLSHGSLRPSAVAVDGTDVMLEDLSDAVLSPDERDVRVDQVQLVATVMVVVGPDRAAASMLRALGHDEVTAVLPYLQGAVLSPELRRLLKPVGDLGDIVDHLLEATGLRKPERARIRRVRVGDLVLVAFGIFAVNAVLSQIAEIGFDVLWEELTSASAGWLVVAFLVGLSGAWGDVVSLRGAVSVAVPTAPTMLLQTAKSFVGLTVPTMAGRVAMDVRYLQQLGVPTTVALAQGPLISFGGFLVEVVILLVSAWRVGQEMDLDELGPGNLDVILAVVLAAIALAIGALAVVPALRRRVLPPILEALRSVGDVVRSPGRVLRILAGQLVIRVTSGLALAATLEAFGHDVSFAAAMFVAVGVGLLAGLAPVPGGVGVAEALLTSLLVAVGVPPEGAFSAAITYRLLTSYLPPLLGWFSFRWLQRAGYL